MSIFNLVEKIFQAIVEDNEFLPWNFEAGSYLLKVDIREPLVLDDNTKPSLNVFRHRLVDRRPQVQAHWEVVRDLLKNKVSAEKGEI